MPYLPSDKTHTHKKPQIKIKSQKSAWKQMREHTGPFTVRRRMEKSKENLRIARCS